MTWNAYPTVDGDEFATSSEEALILRELAVKYADACTDPCHSRRKRFWSDSNQLKGGMPPVAVFPENWHEVEAVSNLVCSGEGARSLEFQFRQLLWQYENIPDDCPLDQGIHVSKVIRSTGWGVDFNTKEATAEHGSWGFVPGISGMEDAMRIQTPILTYDAAASEEKLARVTEIFSGIVDCKLSGVKTYGFHLAAMYSNWRGLNGLYMDFYDAPELMNYILDRLTDGLSSMTEQMEALNLFDYNRDGTYVGSGGFGYTDELVIGDSKMVSPASLWCNAEDQELAVVSPRMHDQFFIRRAAELLRPFGLNAYGCCEPLHDKLTALQQIPRLRKISASPWADVSKFAEALGRSCIISWKPNPALLTSGYDEEQIYHVMREGIASLKGCCYEILMQDLKTCDGLPERSARWVEITRKALEDVGV